ncbi:MAG: lipoyl synthase [Spirochaetes bacterium]|nr:lipoyl synthase [Spirochaetota bacterium]
MRNEGRVAGHRKPEWLKKSITYSSERHETERVLKEMGLNTVCSHARCPNLSECYSCHRATFMILGSRCTRNCTFCSIEKAHGNAILPVDEDEPARIAAAVERLGLRYVVITSVTRDDLPDGGASQFAKTIERIRKLDESVGIEVLTPDFLLNRDAIDTVACCGPDVFNHNIETVRRLYDRVRPKAVYGRSLDFLRYIRDRHPAIFLKSGLMVGLGETKEEVLELLADLRRSGCEAVTIGQYLRPGRANIPVVEYIAPERFEFYEREAKRLGFRYVASGPYVRSSYMAHRGFELLRG